MDECVSCVAPLWRWTGGNGGTWHFLTITGEPAEALAATALMRRLEGLGRGFGSLRVEATIGASTWRTSVFPQKSADGAPEWILPVKAAIRRAEGLAEGDAAELTLRF
jgi:hypothetical protein